ncbi:hypothetical protein WH297_17215 [Ochrobactrum vermis]|uniref:Uncharacterized protein n=1 Tax=Ochrobactrum vermis TaxID=1827297 RepID=A0ABU8PGX2_9HYPH|nr:hypothetical protein [Ochrobactrum vermis]PQZ25819.1 hypothetical protein CQZ93_17505 [Ochrobactrum vermis]
MSNRSGTIGAIIHGNTGKNSIITSETIGVRITAIIVDRAGIHTAITGTILGVTITDTTITVGHV